MPLPPQAWAPVLALVLLHAAAAHAAPARTVVLVEGAGTQAQAVEQAVIDALVAAEPPEIPVIDGGPPCDDDACLRERAAARGARRAVQVVVIRGAERPLLLVRRLDGPDAPARVVTAALPADDAVLAAETARLLAETLGGDALAARPAPPPVEAGATPWYKQWWLWGVVVIAAVATAVIAVQSADDDPAGPARIDVIGPDPAALLPP